MPHAGKISPGAPKRSGSADLPATVYVIDDDADVRAAMDDLLASAGLRCETFAMAEDFLSAPRSDAAGCIILDVSLPGMNGLAFQQRIAEAGLRIPVIFLTAHGDIPMTVSAMKSGAAEFFTKPFDDQQLLEAVQAALNRDRRFRAQRDEAAAVRSRYERLTPRERQVMELALTGKLNKEIAAQLGTSVITVKVHRAHVMRKMQAGSLLDLARLAEKLRQDSAG